MTHDNQAELELVEQKDKYTNFFNNIIMNSN